MANLKQIKKYLRQKNLPFKTVKLNGKAYTVEDVAKSGVCEHDIVKTLIVRTNEGFAALALRGDDRADFKKVRKLLGSKSELARPDEVLRIVGVPLGAVCPVLVGIPLYFEQKVMDVLSVHMGSGDLEFGLEMKLSDLLLACDFTVSDFAACA